MNSKLKGSRNVMQRGDDIYFQIDIGTFVSRSLCFEAFLSPNMLYNATVNLSSTYNPQTTTN